MAKILLFDFDGVIVDSMSLKADVFRAVLRSFKEDQVEELVQFHFANGGVSRFDKFRYFFREVVGDVVDENVIAACSAQFSTMVKSQLSSPAFLIRDTVQYLENVHRRFELHLVSGSEHHELVFLSQALKIAGFFKSISGSPTAKVDLVHRIIDSDSVRTETAMIGDSITDFEAARANNVQFFGYNNPDLRDIGDGYIDKFIGVTHPWE